MRWCIDVWYTLIQGKFCDVLLKNDDAVNAVKKEGDTDATNYLDKLKRILVITKEHLHPIEIMVRLIDSN